MSTENQKTQHPKIIAIDFDGCLCKNCYPEIGSPNWIAIFSAINEQKSGAKLILWTCRQGDLLKRAVLWCVRHGLYFDAVNDNLPEMIEVFNGSNSRKIFANEYWDDRSVSVAWTHHPTEEENDTFKYLIKRRMREGGR